MKKHTRHAHFPMVGMILLVLCFSLMASTGGAQSNDVVIKLAVPNFAQDLFSEDYLAQFEAENPGIRVVLDNGSVDYNYTSAANNLNDHLEGAEKYVSSADVLFVNEANLSVEATRAGYFLDLSPLVSIDSTLNESDFVTAAWESYRWDNATWALPVTVNPVLLFYNPTAFDSAGLAYPTDFWTLDDLTAAARVLAVKDANGNITQGGFLGGDFSVDGMLLGLSGERMYDDSVVPTLPRLAQPGLEALLQQWQAMVAEGIIMSDFRGQIDDLPLFASGPFQLLEIPGQQARQATLLPGGRSILDVQGFAVSRGTAYPEASYALAKWLTRQPDVVERLFGSTAARQSLNGVEGTEDSPFNLPPFTPEQQALLQRAVSSGISVSEARFLNYLTTARNSVVRDGTNPLVALQDAETLAVTNLQTAASMHENTVLFVATPVPDASLSSGEIALKFGLPLNLSTLPNGEEWQQAIDDFVAADPEVGQLIQVVSSTSLEGYAESTDCYYLQQNVVPVMNLQLVLNLDPFMDADPNFDVNDLLGGVLPQIQRDNRTWAYPVMILPEILRYDGDAFIEHGVVPPQNGWTIDVFNDALRNLKPTPDDPAPFAPRNPGGNYMQILIAAYGGLPFDFRTDPVTVNFTDAATVDAIRQALDLAKDGYIEYEPLSNLTGGFIGGARPTDYIYTELATPYTFVSQNGGDNNAPGITVYPTGSQYSAVVYDIGTAYISATSQNPEACYRWISYFSARPDLFNAMPARRSLINDPLSIAAQGQEVIDFYNTLDAQLQQPNNIVMPGQFSAGQPMEGILLPLWLNRAFDNYVLHDADLQTELEDAQVITTGYLECTKNAPPFDPAVYDDVNDYLREYASCAVAVDSSLAPLFDFLFRDN